MPELWQVGYKHKTTFETPCQSQMYNLQNNLPEEGNASTYEKTLKGVNIMIFICFLT